MSAGAKTCRLCVDTNGPFLNIFELRLDLTTKIKRFLNITINEWDNLPHKICFKCSTKVTEFDEFAQNCEKNQEKLLSKHGKGLQPNNERASKFRSEREKKSTNHIPNDKYSDLINKALSDLPFQDDCAFAKNENPIIFKDISVVLTKFEENVKPIKNNANKNINKKDWKTINVTGIGTAYCCVKCDRCFNVESSMNSHVCSKNKSNYSNINTSNKIKNLVNSEAILDSDLLLPVKSNNTNFINQYLLKMPDNSFVVLRIIDTDVSLPSQSYDVDDVKNQLKNIHVKKTESEGNLLKLPEKSKIPNKIGPLSFMRTRSRSAHSQDNNSKLYANSTEETLQVDSFKNHDEELSKISSHSFKEHLSNLSDKSKNIYPKKRRGKNGRFLKDKKLRSHAAINETDDNIEEAGGNSYFTESSLMFDDSQNQFDALSVNNYDDFDKFTAEYKVSHNQSGKIILSNVNSKKSKTKSKKARIQSPVETEVQSPSIIEALQNKEFFTFVNVDPILQRTPDSSINNLEIEESPCMSIDEDWKPNSRKRRSTDSRNHKPTELDVCYICNKRFMSMSALDSHLEKCFDKNINK